MKEYPRRFNDLRTEKLKERSAQLDGPQDVLKSHEVFAVPVKASSEVLVPGVDFETESLIVSEAGDFTNRYRVVLDGTQKDISFSIDVKNHLTHIQRALINNDEIICAINGGFFLLIDDLPECPPREIVFGTIVKEGALISAQSHDRPLLWVDQKGKLHVTEVLSCGLVTIGEITAAWVGCRSAQPTAILTLYGPDSSVVTHVPDSETGKKRVIDHKQSKTPKGHDVSDLVCLEKDGKVVVEAVNKAGGTPVTAGNFILQGPSSLLQTTSPGCQVELSIANLDIKKIISAVTIGPRISHFGSEDDHPINYDRSLGDNPPFNNRRMARAIIYKTNNGKISFELFDGAPKTEFFKGVTPKEVGEILKQDKIDLAWAYFLDPGQSARLAVRHADGGVEGFGNRHYLRWPKQANQPYMWAGEHGRSVPSLVSAKIKKSRA